MFYIDEFVTDLEQACYRRHATLLAYRRLLNRFEQYCAGEGVSEVGAVDSRLVRDFLASLQGDAQITDSVRGKVSRLRSYFRWLQDQGRIFLSPMSHYALPEAPVRHYPILREPEMRKILSEVPAAGSLTIKGRAILELAYSSALRPRELYNLTISDIDLRRRELFIRQSKGNKDRIVPVGKYALHWVIRYLREVRPRYAKGKTHNYLFVSHKTGEPLTVYGIRWALQETLRRGGFSPIKPYSLRGSAATHLLLAGMGVLPISKLLGHQSIRTTQYYLDVRLKELQQELSRKHPRARMDPIQSEEKGENES
jgi:site-specific recombinase XerD